MNRLQAWSAAFLVVAAAAAHAQTPPFTSQDIDSGVGSVAFDPANGRWTVQAEGNDIWNNSDQFRFTWIDLSGDGEVIARVRSLAGVGGAALNEWAKAGVMIRATTDGGSPHAFMATTGNNGATFQRRETAGGTSTNAGNSGGAFVPLRWVRLVRSANSFTGFWRDDNQANWTQIGGAATVTMAADVLVGLALTSHSDGNFAQAVFDRLTVVQQGTVIYEWRPAAPFNVQAVDGFYEVTLTWDAVTGAQSYTLYRRESGTTTYALLQAGSTGTTHTDTTGIPGVTYEYVVRAVVDGLESADSVSAFGTPQFPPPRTNDHEEGIFEDRCACGSTAPGLPFLPALAAALLLGIGVCSAPRLDRSGRRSILRQASRAGGRPPPLGQRE